MNIQLHNEKTACSSLLNMRRPPLRQVWNRADFNLKGPQEMILIISANSKFSLWMFLQVWCCLFYRLHPTHIKRWISLTKLEGKSAMIYMKKKLSEWCRHLTMLFLSFPLGQFHLQEKMIKKYFYNFCQFFLYCCWLPRLFVVILVMCCYRNKDKGKIPWILDKKKRRVDLFERSAVINFQYIIAIIVKAYYTSSSTLYVNK